MLLIDKRVMHELRKKMKVPTIYWRIQKIQKEYFVAKEDAANLLAAELGIPIYKFLEEPELKRLRELQAKTIVTPPARGTHKRKEAEVKRRKSTREATTQMTANELYDQMSFHPRIRRASRSQFRSRHYTDAIFNAFKCLEVLAKEKSGLRRRGADLMHSIFNENNPIIKLNKMEQDFEIDEQAGFRFIYAGAMIGIRNPKAHAEVQQKDPYRTLEYLSLASLLVERLEEGEKVNER